MELLCACVYRRLANTADICALQCIGIVRFPGRFGHDVPLLTMHPTACLVNIGSNGCVVVLS